MSRDTAIDRLRVDTTRRAELSRWLLDDQRARVSLLPRASTSVVVVESTCVAHTRRLASSPKLLRSSLSRRSVGLAVQSVISDERQLCTAAPPHDQTTTAAWLGFACAVHSAGGRGDSPPPALIGDRVAWRLVVAWSTRSATCIVSVHRRLSSCCSSTPTRPRSFRRQPFFGCLRVSSSSMSRVETVCRHRRDNLTSCPHNSFAHRSVSSLFKSSIGRRRHLTAACEAHRRCRRTHTP